jgi:protein ImuA
MSQGGVSERILFLRRRIAAIEARGGAAGRESLQDCRRRSEEREDFLDPLFAAGRGSLSEIFPARPPDAPAAAAFALAMALKARAARASGALVFIVEDMSAREFGLPYGRGLAAAGVDLSRFALVRVRRPREALWAMEEALKSPACAAVVAETFLASRLYDLAASRRLLLAARRGGALGVLAAQGAEAARFSSAAELRVEIAARLAAPASTVSTARPPLSLMAPFLWRLRVLKARAGLLGALGAFDPAQWREIAFDPDRVAFRHAFPERLPAEAPDRPLIAPSRRQA